MAPKGLALDSRAGEGSALDLAPPRAVGCGKMDEMGGDTIEHLVLCNQDPGYNGEQEVAPALGIRMLGAYLSRHLPADRLRVSVVDFPAGARVEDMADQLDDLAPDVVGLSSYVWSHPHLLRLADRLHRGARPPQVVMGGPQLSLDEADLSKLFAGHPHLDLVVQGEAESALLEYLRLPRHQRPPSQTVVTGTPLSTLPADGPPLLERFPRVPPSSTVFVEISRGCRYRCSYCQIPEGGKGRVRSREQIRREMQWAASHGVSKISYATAALNLDSALLRHLVQDACELDPDARIKHCGEIDYRTLTPEDIEQLGRLRVDLGLGVESVSPEANRVVGRRFDQSVCERAIRGLTAAGADIGLELILGIPGDTLESFDASLAFALQHDVRLQVFQLRVLPGTGLYRRRAELGLDYDAEGSGLLRSCHTLRVEDLHRARDLLRDRVAEAVARGRRARVIFSGGEDELLLDGSGDASEGERLWPRVREFFEQLPGLRLEARRAESWDGVPALRCEVSVRGGERIELAFLEPDAPQHAAIATRDFKLVLVTGPGETPSPVAQQVLTTAQRWIRDGKLAAPRRRRNS